MTSSVILRKLLAEDQVRLTQLLNNKNIWDQLRDYIPHPYSQQDAKEFIELKQSDPYTFAITFDGTFCGVIALMPNTDIHRFNAEIGYWIGEPFWGKGIGTKAVRRIVDMAFTKFKFKRIYAHVFDSNTRSMKILEKNGFVKEGIGKHASYKNGRFFNDIIYAVYNKNFSISNETSA